MKPNPVPYENASPEEQIAFLKTHIENQDETIAKLEDALITNENARQQRAWSIDIASRFYEKSEMPDMATIFKSAQEIYDYAEGAK